MRETKVTAVRELIERLTTAKTTEQAEKVFYDCLEIERRIITEAYESAMTNISQGISMDGIEYYDTTFDNS